MVKVTILLGASQLSKGAVTEIVLFALTVRTVMERVTMTDCVWARYCLAETTLGVATVGVL